VPGFEGKESSMIKNSMIAPEIAIRFRSGSFFNIYGQ
jgi:hypothetical protein